MRLLNSLLTAAKRKRVIPRSSIQHGQRHIQNFHQYQMLPRRVSDGVWNGAAVSQPVCPWSPIAQQQLNQLDADECFDVRLGNGTTVPVNQFVEDVGLHLKTDNFKQRFYLLGLPTGIDCIIGMDFLTENDAWVHPKSKRIVFDLGRDTSTDKSVEVMSVEQFLLDEKISQLEQLPTCGVVNVDEGSSDDYEFANDKVPLLGASGCFLACAVPSRLSERASARQAPSRG
jgi:hypothetical protein